MQLDHQLVHKYQERESKVTKVRTELIGAAYGLAWKILMRAKYGIKPSSSEDITEAQKILTAFEEYIAL